MSEEQKFLPLYYVKGPVVYRRPVRNPETGGTSMGFAVCSAYDGIDPDELAAILNKGEPATS